MNRRPVSRRELRRQVRREAILDVAAQLFIDQGYSGTTMSAVAIRLGGSKGTLWNHFPSKSELFEAVLERATTKFQSSLTPLRDDEVDVRAALARFGREFMAIATSPGAIALFRLVIAETGRFPEVGRIFHQRVRRTIHGILARFIAQSMQSGKLRQGDPDVAARHLTALLIQHRQEMLLLGMQDHDGVQTNHDVQESVDFFLRAYALRGAGTEITI